jgi:hypothetical protein
MLPMHTQFIYIAYMHMGMVELWNYLPLMKVIKRLDFICTEYIVVLHCEVGNVYTG